MSAFAATPVLCRVSTGSARQGKPVAGVMAEQRRDALRLCGAL